MPAETGTKKPAENVANALQVFSAVYKPLHKEKTCQQEPIIRRRYLINLADSEADATGFWNVVYK